MAEGANSLAPSLPHFYTLDVRASQLSNAFSKFEA
jgi:hypothetical protein